MRHKGSHLTEDHRKKISLSMIGKPHPQSEKSYEIARKRLNHKRGIEAANWRGGTTPLSKLIRTSFKYRQWRSDIFTRDNYTCNFCGKVGGKIVADHIKPFSLIIKENNITTFQEASDCEELWNINNGRVLCDDCHYNTDTYGGRKAVV